MVQLDEVNGPVKEEGLETKVIAQSIEAKTGAGSVVFEILLWVLGIIPGVVFLFKKIQARKYFDQLQQKLQQDRSTIDNYIEQRVIILKNCAALVEKAVNLDKETFSQIAALRSGVKPDEFTAANGAVEEATRSFNMVLENYPDLQSHKEIKDAMQQNSYLQKEITAARELYNSHVNQWNRDIFAWPTKNIVASKLGLRTIIPFSASKEIKEQAKEVFF